MRALFDPNNVVGKGSLDAEKSIEVYTYLRMWGGGAVREET